jgi:hypothetical protein
VAQKQLGCSPVKRGIGDRLLKLTSETGESPLSIAGALLERNKVSSELYFAKSIRHLIDAGDTRRLETREITVIYLSFTSVRASIALPGCGVLFKGGTNGTCSSR